MYTVIEALPLAEIAALVTTTNPVVQGLRTFTNIILPAAEILELVKVKDSLVPAPRVVDDEVIWPVIVFDVTALLDTVAVPVSKPSRGESAKDIDVDAVRVIVVPAVNAIVDDDVIATVPPLLSVIVELVMVMRTVPPPS